MGLFGLFRESAESNSREEFEAQHPECLEPGSVEWRITHTGDPGSERYDQNFHFDANVAEIQIQACHNALSSQQEQLAYERDSEIGDLKAKASAGIAGKADIINAAKKVAKVTEWTERCNEITWKSSYKEVQRAQRYAESLLKSEEDVPRERYVPVYLSDGSLARDEKTNAIITIAQQIPPFERWAMLNEAFDGNAGHVDEIIRVLENAERDATTPSIGMSTVSQDYYTPKKTLRGWGSGGSRQVVDPADLYKGSPKKRPWWRWGR